MGQTTDRRSVLDWLEHHPAGIRGKPSEIVDRCERAVRRHAREDAWIGAKRYVEERRHDWEEELGAHASEAYVAREVCHELAYELRRHEPSVGPGDAEHLAGGPVRDALDPEGWAVLVEWILELAREEEHQTWVEIVRYTDHRARELIRQHQLSDDCSFDHSKCYGEIATRIARLLERDYATHAFPR
ncbi:MAG: hypothetical protein QNK04_13780 [Myxococcota bacterium]|nr:hypothetical protein [Myxococcota bacterium]